MAAAPPPQDVPPEPDERPQRHREWSGPLRSVGLPLLAVAVIVFAVWYLEDGRSVSSKPAAGTGVIALDASRNHTAKPAAADLGRAAPDFRLKTIDGQTVRLSDLQGKTVLVNFWATWCPPCRQEMPEIVKAYNDYKDKGLAVVSVDEQEDPGTVQKWVTEFGIPFQVSLDTSGQVGETFHAGTQFPTSVFINPDGTIKGIKNADGSVTAQHFGPMNEQFIAQQLGVQS